MRRPAAITIGLLLLLGASAGGCASREKMRVTSTGAPIYDHLHVVYDVDDRPGQEPAGAAGVRTVAHVEGPAPPVGRLRLELEYPYHGINPEFAHASLRLMPAGTNGAPEPNAQPSGPIPGVTRGYSNSTMRPESTGLLPHRAFTSRPAPVAGQEILAIDLPKSQLDALLYDLAKDGFFDRPAKGPGDARLEVTYNQGEVDKGWSREPRLDDLVSLLKQHGTPATSN